jgi:hypothetical protein
MEFIAAAHKRITSVAAGDLQRLIESELAARADVVQAVEQAAGLLQQHMTATLGVLQQLSAGTARLDDIEKLRQLFVEEAAARRALFDDAQVRWHGTQPPWVATPRWPSSKRR